MKLRVIDRGSLLRGHVGLFMGGTGVYALVLFETGHLCRFDWPSVTLC
jgi:hypothetical protein